MIINLVCRNYWKKKMGHIIQVFVILMNVLVSGSLHCTDEEVDVLKICASITINAASDL